MFRAPAKMTQAPKLKRSLRERYIAVIYILINIAVPFIDFYLSSVQGEHTECPDNMIFSENVPLSFSVVLD